MRVSGAAVIAVLLAAPAVAGNYDSKSGVILMKYRPCGDAIAALSESHIPNPLADPEAFGRAVTEQNTAWGFILGFDAARGGLWDGDQTTLERLKDECAREPQKSALAHLNAMSQP